MLLKYILDYEYSVSFISAYFFQFLHTFFFF